MMPAALRREKEKAGVAEELLQRSMIFTKKI